MAKVTRRVRWSLIVVPEAGYGNEATMEMCEELQSQIRRHVDAVKSVVIHREEDIRCSFCNCKWEVDFDFPPGPQCCQAAIEEWSLASTTKMDGE